MFGKRRHGPFSRGKRNLQLNKLTIQRIYDLKNKGHNPERWTHTLTRNLTMPPLKRGFLPRMGLARPLGGSKRDGGVVVAWVQNQFASNLLRDFERNCFILLQICFGISLWQSCPW